MLPALVDGQEADDQEVGRAVSDCYRRAGAALVAPARTFPAGLIPAETATFELRASEVADPRPGDLLIVDSQTFVVQGEPERRDPDRLVWSLDISPDFPFDLGRG